ncbi:hypothetical protein QUF72_19140 [Desulfobacterales bacterium HSG2]|nr:hypothetical protein [Desulfobacterales bacterium HSG2]
MAKNLKTRIMESLENLVTLEIMTAVGYIQAGPAKAPASKNGKAAHRDGRAAYRERSFPDIDYGKDPKMILTKINLLQGDIKTVYNEEFVTGEYKSLREFHAAREKEAHNIVMQNIAALERLLRLSRDLAEG